MNELTWQKSSFSSGDVNTNCVEVACPEEGALHLREGDDPAVALTTPPTALQSLLSYLKSGCTTAR